MSVIMKVKYLLAIALKNQRKNFFKENCLMKYQKGFSNLAGPSCACSCKHFDLFSALLSTLLFVSLFYAYNCKLFVSLHEI